MSNFRSGYYAEQDLKILIKDSENKILKFEDKYFDQIQYKLMQEELIKYSLKLDNSNTDIMVTSENIDLDKLNAIIYYKNKKEQTILLKSNFGDEQITIPVKIQFRNCQIGEIITQKLGFIQCEKCGQGTYSLKDPSLEENISCKQCPFEAEICEGGSKILLKDGYWRPHNLTDNIHQCKLNGCSEKNQDNKNGCLIGYIGPLCQSCDSKGSEWGEQYGLNDLNCLKCNATSSQLTFLCCVFLFYLIYFISGFSLLVRRVKTNTQLQIFRRIGVLVISKQEFIGYDRQVLMKVFLSYIQILSSSSLFLNTSAKDFKTFLDIGGDPTVQSTRGLNCTVKFIESYPLWFHKFIITLSQMFIYIVILLILQKIQQRKNKIKRNYFKMIFIFIYLFYQPSFSKQLISLIFYVNINGRYYVLNDYSQEYFEGYHKYYSIFIIYPFSFLFCIVLPIYFLIKIKKYAQNRQHLQVNYLFSYQLLSVGFKKTTYYWEILIIIYKFIIMAILNLQISQLNQLLLIVTVVSIYQQILILKKPFKNSVHFNLDKKLTFLIIISLLFQAVLSSTAYDNMNNQKIEFLFSFIIAFLNIFGILIWLLTLLKIIILPLPQNKLLKVLVKYLQKHNIITFRKVSIFRVHKLWQQLKKNIKSGQLQQQEFSLKIQQLSKININHAGIFNSTGYQNAPVKLLSNQFSPTAHISPTQQVEINYVEGEQYEESPISLSSIPPERQIQQDPDILSMKIQDSSMRILHRK